MRKKLFTEEIEAFVREESEGMFVSELCEKINNKFGTDFTPQQISNFKKEKGIRSNRRGSNSTNGRFQPGRLPSNTVPVGTLRLRIIRGCHHYLFIKTADPNGWTAYHTWLWEQENGPIPKDHIITFLNRNTLDVRLENMMCIPRSVLVILNRKGFLGTDPDINKATILQAMLEREMYKRGVRKLNHWKERGKWQ